MPEHGTLHRRHAGSLPHLRPDRPHRRAHGQAREQARPVALPQPEARASRPSRRIGRYAFMFGSLTVYDGMAQILGRIFRVPVNDKPITILELTGLPTEIVNVVVSVLCRMTFDFALWSEGKVPVTLVCEEAHRYVPANRPPRLRALQARHRQDRQGRPQVRRFAVHRHAAPGRDRSDHPVAVQHRVRAAHVERSRPGDRQVGDRRHGLGPARVPARARPARGHRLRRRRRAAGAHQVRRAADATACRAARRRASPRSGRSRSATKASSSRSSSAGARPTSAPAAILASTRRSSPKASGPSRPYPLHPNSRRQPDPRRAGPQQPPRRDSESRGRHPSRLRPAPMASRPATRRPPGRPPDRARTACRGCRSHPDGCRGRKGRAGLGAEIVARPAHPAPAALIILRRIQRDGGSPERMATTRRGVVSRAPPPAPGAWPPASVRSGAS